MFKLNAFLRRNSANCMSQLISWCEMIFPLVTFMFRIFDKHSISSGEHKLALLKPTK